MSGARGSKYQLTEVGRGSKLGEGAFASVWEVLCKWETVDMQQAARVDPNNVIGGGRKFATKDAEAVLKPKETDSSRNVIRHTLAVKLIAKKGTPNERKRVLNEIEIWQSLKHRNILRCYEFFETLRAFWIINEPAYGDNLLNRLKKVKFFSLSDAATVTKQMVDALKYMHNQGIIHRDLKPENVLYLHKPDSSNSSTKHRICLCDFGVATRMKVNHEGDPPTATGNDGTPSYKAPEVSSTNRYTGKVDMWSLGMVCFELLSGIKHSIKQDQRIEFNGGAWDSATPDNKNSLKEAEDFICGCLQFNVDKRLSSEKGFEHKWLKMAAANIFDGTETVDKWKEGIKKAVIANRLQEAVQKALGSGASKDDIDSWFSKEAIIVGQPERQDSRKPAKDTSHR